MSSASISVQGHSAPIEKHVHFITFEGKTQWGGDWPFLAAAIAHLLSRAADQFNTCIAKAMTGGIVKMLASVVALA